MVAFSGFRVFARNDSEKAPLSLFEEYRELGSAPAGDSLPAPLFPELSHLITHGFLHLGINPEAGP